MGTMRFRKNFNPNLNQHSITVFMSITFRYQDKPKKLNVNVPITYEKLLAVVSVSELFFPDS